MHNTAQERGNRQLSPTLGAGRTILDHHTGPYWTTTLGAGGTILDHHGLELDTVSAVHYVKECNYSVC